MGHWLLQLDHTITFSLYHSGALNSTVQKLLYDLASWFVYLTPIALIVLFWQGGKNRINSVKVALAGLFAWFALAAPIGNFLYSHYGFRDRPFVSLGIKELLLQRPDKAFPSDHATFLMAVTLAFFAYGYRKLGWFFLIGGVIISCIARVAVGIHWFGDIVGGWAFGGIGFAVIWAINTQLTNGLNRLFRSKNG